MITPEVDAPRPRLFFGRLSSWWQLVFPWTWARLIFAPIGVYPPTGTAGSSALHRIRAVAGAVVFVLIMIDFDPVAYSQLLPVAIHNVMTGAVWGSIIVVAICLLVVPFVVPTWRTRALCAALRPVIRLALLAVIIAALIGSGFLWYRDGLIGNTPPPVDPQNPNALILVGYIGLTVWIVVFLLACVYYIAGQLVAVSDVHPALAPVVTVAVSLVLYAGTSIPGVADVVPLFPAPPYDLPSPQFAQTFGIVSLIVLTGLCVADYFSARRFFSIRNGPWR